MPDDILAETWKPCLDDNYSISSLGRIARKTSAKGTRIGRILKSHLRGGYFAARAKLGKRTTNHFVHQLVARAFVGLCPDGMEVNHKNGIKTDNRASNLEYVTRSENVKHAIALGLRARQTHPPPHVPGTRNGRAKLNDAQITEIRARKAHGQTDRSLAEQYAVSKSAIYYICKRLHWSHVT